MNTNMDSLLNLTELHNQQVKSRGVYTFQIQSMHKTDVCQIRGVISGN